MTIRVTPNAVHAFAALASGVITEALYAIGVIVLVDRRGLAAAGVSVIWGASFLFGVHQSFKSRTAAAAYCIGLGAGTFLGSWISTRCAEFFT